MGRWTRWLEVDGIGIDLGRGRDLTSGSIGMLVFLWPWDLAETIYSEFNMNKNKFFLDAMHALNRAPCEPSDSHISRNTKEPVLHTPLA